MSAIRVTRDQTLIHMWNGGGRYVAHGQHSHICPECYQDVACEDECTIEFDLSNGTLRGAYAVCDACKASKQ